MKVFQLMLNALLVGTVSAGWIYPSKYWRSVSQTLPGATYRKRSVPPPSARLLERGGQNLWQACSTANLASKYNKYPINGFAAAGAQIGSVPQSSYNNGYYYFGPVTTIWVNATSAYDCCVQAQQMSNSTVFYFSSTQNTNPNDYGGLYSPYPQCQIVTSNYCQYPTTTTLVFGATYNNSEPRGTTYGNYLGNGQCGPGYTVAFPRTTGDSCASAGAYSNGNFSGASASAQACYVPPNSPDLGGATPAG